MINAPVAKNNMPLLNLRVRRNSFLEVALGYTPEQAMEEASRCLKSKEKLCASTCPLNVNIPGFVAEVAKGNFEEAYEIITEANVLPAVCSRICSANPKCERACAGGGEAPLAIAALERFVADYHNFNCAAEKEEKEYAANGHKVAVIGAGPAGLYCAGELAKKGYGVTVFEESNTADGLMDHGIPEFRLPKSAVRRDIEALGKLGVEIVVHSPENSIDAAAELVADEGYDAAYISEYAEFPVKPQIKGEELKGIISADSFLNWVNTKDKDKYYINAPLIKGCNAVVIGGGAKALDAARSIRRFGADVTVMYKYTEKELEACPEEIRQAMEEDVKFRYLVNPVEFFGNGEGKVEGVVCEELMMRTAQGAERPELIPLYDSEFDIPADLVIVAADADANGYDTSPAAIENGVFCFRGAATVIEAMGLGKNAADLIDNYIRTSVHVKI